MVYIVSPAILLSVNFNVRFVAADQLKPKIFGSRLNYVVFKIGFFLHQSGLNHVYLRP